MAPSAQQLLWLFATLLLANMPKLHLFSDSPAARDVPELSQTMGALVVGEEITPTPSEIEDQASPEKVVGTSSSAVKISCKFEHLWEGLALSEETKHFLRLYANLDCGPFIVMEKTQFKTFRTAQVLSLGGLLTELSQWSFSRLESEESKQFEALIVQLEAFGVPCKLLKTRLSDLRIVKPSETKALLSQQSDHCNVLSSQQDALLKREKEVAKRIGDLQAELQGLEEEARTIGTLLDAAKRDLARADEERAKAFDLISPHMTQSNPLAALLSVMDFFLS